VLLAQPTRCAAVSIAYMPQDVQCIVLSRVWPACCTLHHQAMYMYHHYACPDMRESCAHSMEERLFKPPLLVLLQHV
jgi:hypothetical protein